MSQKTTPEKHWARAKLVLFTLQQRVDGSGSAHKLQLVSCEEHQGFFAKTNLRVQKTAWEAN